MTQVLNIFSRGLEYSWLFNRLCNLENHFVLIQDGVYLLGLLQEKNIPVTAYAVQIDVASRGLLELYSSNNIKLISYEKFVELIIQYDKNITW